MSEAITVTIAPDKATFSMVDGQWSQTLPIDQLPAQIMFYRRLYDRENKRYAKFYAPTVKALIKAQLELT